MPLRFNGNGNIPLKLKRSFEFNTYDFRFFGYFTEAVSGEPRNRYVHLLYHLEDDTISLLGNINSCMKVTGSLPVCMA